MKKIHILLTCITFLFVSCNKKEIQPYSIFWFQGETVTSEAFIPVKIGEYSEILIECGFQTGSPKYSLQRNNMVPEPIETSSIITEGHGWNGEQSLYFETIRLGLNFDSTKYSKGDVIRVITRHSGLRKDLQLVIF